MARGLKAAAFSNAKFMTATFARCRMLNLSSSLDPDSQKNKSVRSSGYHWSGARCFHFFFWQHGVITPQSAHPSLYLPQRQSPPYHRESSLFMLDAVYLSYSFTLDYSRKDCFNLCTHNPGIHLGSGLLQSMEQVVLDQAVTRACVTWLPLCHYGVIYQIVESASCRPSIYWKAVNKFFSGLETL